MQTNDPMPSGARRKRWSRIALILSLALNMLLVGVLVGGALRDGDSRARKDGASMSLRPMIQALSPEMRRKIGREIGKNLWKERRRNANTVRVDLAPIIDVLRQEPFDPAALEAAFEQHLARLSNRQSIAQQVYRTHIAAMSDTERAAYADRLEQHLRRPRKKSDR